MERSTSARFLSSSRKVLALGARKSPNTSKKMPVRNYRAPFAIGSAHSPATDCDNWRLKGPWDMVPGMEELHTLHYKRPPPPNEKNANQTSFSENDDSSSEILQRCKDGQKTRLDGMVRDPCSP